MACHAILVGFLESWEGEDIQYVIRIMMIIGVHRSLIYLTLNCHSIFCHFLSFLSLNSSIRLLPFWDSAWDATDKHFWIHSVRYTKTSERWESFRQIGARNRLPIGARFFQGCVGCNFLKDRSDFTWHTSTLSYHGSKVEYGRAHLRSMHDRHPPTPSQ